MRAEGACSLKRKRSPSPARTGLTERELLTTVQQLRKSGRGLQLLLSDGAVLLCSKGVIVPVPARLTARCSVLRDAPDGDLTNAVDVSKFSLWLEHEWSRELNGHSCLRPTSAEDVSIIWELLKASDFFGDDVAVGVYSQLALTCIKRQPLSVDLSGLQRLYHFSEQCSLPLRLLADLLPHLATRVIQPAPLDVLDRLPQDSSVVRLCCELSNTADYATRWSRATDQQRWVWRSAAACEAGTRIRVSIDHKDWTKPILDSYKGLHVVSFDMELTGITNLVRAPDTAEHLRLHGTLDPWDSLDLRLPTSLQSLELEIQPMSPRLRLADMRLPAALRNLKVWGESVAVAMATLPTSLTSFTVDQEAQCYSDPDEVDLTGLKLPAGLLELTFVDTNVGCSICGLQLPPALTFLRASLSQLDPHTARSLHLPTTLRSVVLSDVELSGEVLGALQLPAHITHLALQTRQPFRVELPAGLVELHLDELSPGSGDVTPLEQCHFPEGLRCLRISMCNLKDSGWLAEQALPPSLTGIFLEAEFVAETLRDVAWPVSLQELHINYSFSKAVLELHTLHVGLRSLKVDHCHVDVSVLQLPATVNRVDFDEVTLQSSGDRSAIAWPTGLQHLVLKRITLGTALTQSGWLHVVFSQLPSGLATMSSNSVDLSCATPVSIDLPSSLRSLDLSHARFGEGGLQMLRLPSQLTELTLLGANLGPCGYAGVVFPDTVQVLRLPTSDESGCAYVGEEQQVPQLVRPARLRCLSLHGTAKIGVQRVYDELLTDQQLVRLADVGGTKERLMLAEYVQSMPEFDIFYSGNVDLRNLQSLTAFLKQF